MRVDFRGRPADDRTGRHDRRRAVPSFLRRALADDAVADSVDELLSEHVVEGRFHPSVVAETLPGFLGEVVGAARTEDWQIVADDLIADAREADGEV